ncbi:MAG: DNA polymerase IV [Patescibacteria group bacterium]
MILHIDMNAYFATMEQQANPFLRRRPILVCGKGSGERTVVATASYEAKNRGVKTGMAVWEAKKLVPEALIVAADYDKYLDTTRRLGEIFEHYTPDVEFFSIDEAFLAISNVKDQISNQIQSSKFKFDIESFEFDLTFGFGNLDFETQTALAVALNIKRDVKEKIGDYVTCSIGIAQNKLLAKIASEFRKPDGLTVVIQEEVGKIPDVEPVATPGVVLTKTQLYSRIKLDDIPGIGPRILRRLLILGITTPAILGQAPLAILVKEFGKHEGQVLYNLGRGIDHSPVVRNELMPEEKSFSHSYTLPKEIYTLADAKKVLLQLCEMVGRRMRKKGFAGRTIGVLVRFTDMTAAFERKTFKEYTNNGLKNFQIGEWLIQKTWAFRYQQRPIRQVGIWVTNLIHECNLPLPLFEEDRQALKAIKAMDQINDRYGEHTIMHSPILGVYKKIQKIPDGRNRRQFGT